MDVQIVASLLGGLVSGLFTFVGVFLTISYQRKKDKAEEERIKKEEKKKEFDNRPRFEIENYKGETLYEDEDSVDVGMLVCSIRDFKNNGRALFYYDKEIKTPQEWVFAEYVLKNTGKTEISQAYFVTNLPKNTSIFNTSNGENVMCYNNNFLNYKVRLDKSVKPGQSVKIRVYFVRNKIVCSNIGNPLISIWLLDEYGKMWYQDLDAPNNGISDTHLTTKAKLLDYTDERTAIECFINPMMW